MDNMYMQNYANYIENIMRGFESMVDKMLGPGLSEEEIKKLDALNGNENKHIPQTGKP